MNKMEEVAKILGVAMEEEFDIDGAEHNPYRITKTGLASRRVDVCHLKFTRLITGEHKIIKRPFKPAKGGGYWYVGSSGEVWPDSNTHYLEDYCRISSGNCFRTEAEAKAAAPEIVKKMQDFFAEA